MKLVFSFPILVTPLMDKPGAKREGNQGKRTFRPGRPGFAWWRFQKKKEKNNQCVGPSVQNNISPSPQEGPGKKKEKKESTSWLVVGRFPNAKGEVIIGGRKGEEPVRNPISGELS